jgi:hypothetical protein
MKTKTVFLLLLIGVFVACNQTPKSKTQQESINSNLVTTGADTLAACPHSSQINWKGFKPAGEHSGIVKLKPGGIILVKVNQLVGIDVVIDLTSITDSDLTDPKMNEMLVKHLKSPDFFNVDSFPTARFILTGISKTNDNSQFEYLVSGNMTIKNITKPITFKANYKIEDGIFSAESESFMIDRTQWKVNYGSKSIFKELTDKFINDEFSIQISLKSM